MPFLKLERSRSTSLDVFLVITLFLVSAATAPAEIITFEQRPDGSTPVDDEDIGLTTGFLTNDGVTVTFGFDTNNDGVADLAAAFEDTLDKPATGSGKEDEFGYCSTNYGSFDCSTDQAAAGYENQLGDFFIRQSGPQGTDWDSFIIEYDAPNPVTAASGEIWDIDRGVSGWELFHVTAYDVLGAVLETQISPQGKFEHNPETLDAKPWAWTFSGLSDIDKIVFTRDTNAGSKPYFPLGFNNFNPTSNAVFVPEPSSSLLLTLGLCLWARVLRR
jgi:hypothetical protein